MIFLPVQEIASYSSGGVILQGGVPIQYKIWSVLFHDQAQTIVTATFALREAAADNNRRRQLDHLCFSFEDGSGTIRTDAALDRNTSGRIVTAALNANMPNPQG